MPHTNDRARDHNGIELAGMRRNIDCCAKEAEQ